MTDRFVRINQDPTSALRQFSEFNTEPNLVLLGDPGAGKTHLFKSAACACGGRYLTARDFLNLPPSKLQDVDYLFIDALDERRSGSNDHSTIDDIARRLYEVTPKYLRIACRAADWLGEFDLSAISQSRSDYGQFTTLILESLSTEEQKDLLNNTPNKGNLSKKDFIAEAENHQLNFMLKNPQTLLLLWEMINKKKSWPTTKKELFSSSIDLLIEEQNSTHKSKSKKSEHLLEAAGAICALQLISDTKLAKSPNNHPEDYLYYNDISLASHDDILSALASRLFVADTNGETFDCLHRTLAEFSAARWLADKIKQGLSFRRVITLITHERVPTTELRGLHAWLAVFLPPDTATILIDADPFGVMTYGDPAALTPNSRLHLIQALSTLAKQDPWFRANHWHAPISGLGQSDLLDEFRQILDDSSSPLGLRSIILDAIYDGQLADKIQDILCLIAKNDSFSNRERFSAINSLAQIKTSGHDVVKKLYDNLADSTDNIIIKFYIMGFLYGSKFDRQDMVNFLNYAMSINIDLYILIECPLYPNKKIPKDDIDFILNNLDSENNSQDHYEISQLVCMLTLRIIPNDTKYEAKSIEDNLEPPMTAGDNPKFSDIKEDILRENQIQFDALKNKSSIDFINFICPYYFKCYQPSSKQYDLIEAFGEDRANQALSAIKDFTINYLYPSIKEIKETKKNHFPPFWYSILAGLHELHNAGYPIDRLDEQKLRSALFIDLLAPAYIKDPMQSSWQLALIESKFDLSVDTYADFIEYNLTNKRSDILYIHELGSNKALKKIHSNFIIKILEKFPTRLPKKILKHLIKCVPTEASDKLKLIIPSAREAAASSNDHEAWAIWTALGMLLGESSYIAEIKSSKIDTDTLIWAARDIFELPHQKQINIQMFLIEFIGSKKIFTRFPNSILMGNKNNWDAIEFITTQINNLASSPTQEASSALERLIADDSLASYRSHLQHALAKQRIVRTDKDWQRPSWQNVQKILSNGAPTNITDLQSILMDYIYDIDLKITNSDTDIYKQFWNVDQHNKIGKHRPEESCRDILLEMLRASLIQLNIRAEPEKHMANDKRVDICLFFNQMKLPIELKCNDHRELWTAIELQLIPRYTTDPEAQGYGVYGVFWFGSHKLQAPPSHIPPPKTAAELKQALIDQIPTHLRTKIQVFVLDVSGSS